MDMSNPAFFIRKIFKEEAGCSMIMTNETVNKVKILEGERAILVLSKEYTLNKYSMYYESGIFTCLIP